MSVMSSSYYFVSFSSAEGNVTHGLEVFAMAEFRLLRQELESDENENGNVDVLRPVKITIPITGSTENLRNYQAMTAWYFDETSGM